jgi:hypothetical protein
VQIDNFPCCSAQACYDGAHGHPPGYGAWWSEAWNDILADVRRAAKERDPECALSTEAISENFIPHLDLYDQRSGNSEYFVGRRMANSPMGGENIALFNYIYNPYIGSYLAAYPESNRPEVLYWTRSLGKALTQGVVPTGGRYFPEPPGLNPVTISFYQKVVRAAAHECWPYIMFGDMLRPPVIDVPIIAASYLRHTPDCDHLDPDNRHVVEDTAVQHSSWRGPDGTVAHIFANVSEQPVAFEVELPAYGDGPGPVDVDRVVDGVREPWLRAAALPARGRLDMAPLSVTLVEVRRSGARGS